MERRIRQPIELSEYTEIDRFGTRREARNDAGIASRRLQSARENGRKPSRDELRRVIGERPFVAWDGEGWTDSDGVHHYMLFGASSGDCISAPSLGTKECLDLLLRVEEANPDVFHVVFAGNYDVNMILRDVGTKCLTELKERGNTVWRGYHLQYFRSKMFRVRKGKTTMTLYDVFTFFGCSFVKALDQYLGSGEDANDINRIKEGKGSRAIFEYTDLSTVSAYMQTELRYLVKLCEALRTYLSEADIQLTRWHGPGAVASAVLKGKGFKRVDPTDRLRTASQYAYSGGRFEQFRVGTHHGSVWAYDIRSAYPSAIRTLPKLSPETVWLYRVFNGIVDREELKDFGIYRAEFRAKKSDPRIPYPLFWRNYNGCVFYPWRTDGWYWGIELREALKHWPLDVMIEEGYEIEDSGERPFAWIAGMYNKRAAWKANGNPAQLALKLAMNSIYGKLAQQKGWRKERDGTIRIPTYHQLEYAGYITAHARSVLYGAMMEKPWSVVACETDAVYVTEPLESLTVGKGLGEWEEEHYDGIMYLQSGLYFARVGDEWKVRTRGFARTGLDSTRVKGYLSTLTDAESAYIAKPLTVVERRFRTLGTSIGKPNWRKWEEEERQIAVGLPGGKREHYGPYCGVCNNGRESMAMRMHDMIPAVSLPNVNYEKESTRYPLGWMGDPPSYWPEDLDEYDEFDIDGDEE